VKYIPLNTQQRVIEFVNAYLIFVLQRGARKKSMRIFVISILVIGFAHAEPFRQVVLDDLRWDLRAHHAVTLAATAEGIAEQTFSPVSEKPLDDFYVHRYAVEKTNDPRVGPSIILHPDVKRFRVAQNQSKAQTTFDLSKLFLGQNRQAIETAMGPSKGVKDVPVRGEQDPRTGVYSWLKLSEYYYRKAGYVIRVIYGRKDEAISIFVGLSGKTQALIGSFGDWPVDKLSLPVRWGGGEV
jgi:hypothetical protein